MTPGRNPWERIGLSGVRNVLLLSCPMRAGVNRRRLRCAPLVDVQAPLA